MKLSRGSAWRGGGGGGSKWERHNKPDYEWRSQISPGQLAAFNLVSVCSIAQQSFPNPYYYGEFLGSSLVKVQGYGCVAPAHRADWPGKACGPGKGPGSQLIL